MLAHIGHSDDPDSQDAVAEVIQQLTADLGGVEPKGALLYCSVEYDHQLILDAIQREWRGLPLVGATSDGEFSTRLGCCDDSLLLVLFTGDDLVVHAGVGRQLSKDPEAAAHQALLHAGAIQPSLCLTNFAPTSDAVVVIESLSGYLPGVRCPVLGGLSADHRGDELMHEFFGNEVLRDALPVLLIEGDVAASWGVGSGWHPIGPEMLVTRAAGSVLEEIDGSSALGAYRERYGGLSDESLAQYPLACVDESGHWVLRAALGQDEVAGSLSLAGSVPEDTVVRFTQVAAEGLLSGSEQSLRQAFEAFEGTTPRAVLVFSCAARKWMLGSDAQREIELFQGLAADFGWGELPVAGFFCFGEIAPGVGGPHHQFHNESCVTLVLG